MSPDSDHSLRDSLRYGVLGTGALGGLYGGLLAKAGQDVHFLARSDFEYLREHGLKVDTPSGNFHLPELNVYRAPEEMPQIDVAIVAWKTTSNAALRETLPAVCHHATSVLVLQNGLDVEREAADVVGASHILGGCCFLCSNKAGPGHIHHLDYGTIVFGEYAPSLRGHVTKRMKKLTEDFQQAGIDMRPDPDLMLTRWKKLVWNIPFNGLSVVLQANTAAIMRDPSAAQLAEQLMHEVCQAAEACGVHIESSHVQTMLDATRKMVPYDSSMSLDYRAKRPIEVESIFGNPLRVAQAAGYRPAKIEMLYEQLCFLDRQNRS